MKEVIKIFPFFFDISMIILIPGLILSAYAQFKVNSTYSKYLRAPSKRGFTGVEVAQRLLQQNGISDVSIELVRGKLSDHYDPRNKVLRLSNEVYNGRSLASAGIAAHEVGHAIQHNVGYLPLKFRNTIAPLVGVASNMSWYLFIIGLIFDYANLMELGIVFFSAAVVFNLITLPVEFNASSTAVAQLEGSGLIYEEEGNNVKKVLSAAALTYVAATVVAFLQLFRMLALRGSRR